MIASKYSAQQVMRIDRRITNRNIMLAGGVTELVGGARMEGMNRRPIKVFTDTDRSRPSSAVRGIDLLERGQGSVG